MTTLHTIQFHLTPEDNDALANLCGWHSEHLSQLELRLGVEINHLGFKFSVTGLAERLVQTEQFIRDLYQMAQKEPLDPPKVHLALQSLGFDEAKAMDDDQLLIKTRKKTIKTRNANQANYIQSVKEYDVSFGIGPAGTGKTYLAVATAVEALESEQVRRIILTRPAVEAGEKLGFLPGDLNQKVDPYLRPLFDALFEMLGFETVEKLIEKHIIEIAPLAFMRGRTLNESFIILDEAQNTTTEQMKMFLTRIGFGSKAVVTGDITQCDLPNHQRSGLRHVIEVLEGVPGIGFTFYQSQDVVRHNLVQKIVQAYDQFDRRSAAK
ncbi:PhoH-like protein [Hydrogenovibrio crunogenus]|uniref:PhoH-like protein n=1 Tax=Hydrogenovibrio crunogenus TaxID=39765 RepID=A0A4V1C8N0_9GAMM|nr:PhoH family protein [Hydrogenovibrio crunogenus]QBZ82474.1 PhoH-like protein [Hydrogenovibrio crunogenus]RUM92759.1 MAG: phosphate starvation-inducible protein PhoH [Thiomicrospira sp.]